jgi:Kef-type K+ transport system membrane component KefB
MVGFWLAQNWIQKMDESAFARKYPEFIFVVAMLLAFAYAMIAEIIGLSAIVVHSLPVFHWKGLT